MKKKQPANPQPEKSSIKFHEYLTPSNESWVVEDFQKLSGLFASLTPELLPALHALSESRKEYGAPWSMIQRLCGVRHAIIPIGVDAAKLKPMGREKVAEIFQTTTEEVELSISLLQTAWHHLLSDAAMPEVREQAVPKKAARPVSQGTGAGIEFTAEQLELLQLGAFSTSIFDYSPSDSDKFTEIEWFCDQVRDVRKVFEEPMAKELARLALLNALQLRRINDRIVIMDPTSKDYVKLQDVKLSLEKTYGEQWEQVGQICPVAVASASRKTAVNHLSDLVKAYQQYKSDPNNRMRDGIFTDDELQILFRSSMQDPDVGYRMGWVVACNEAKHGIDDPKWKRRMPIEHCKILDASFKFAARKLTETLGVHRPDLEITGPAGEYPSIHVAADGAITSETFEEAMEAKPEEESVEIAD